MDWHGLPWIATHGHRVDVQERSELLRRLQALPDAPAAAAAAAPAIATSIATSTAASVAVPVEARSEPPPHRLPSGSAGRSLSALPATMPAAMSDRIGIAPPRVLQPPLPGAATSASFCSTTVSIAASIADDDVLVGAGSDSGDDELPLNGSRSRLYFSPPAQTAASAPTWPLNTWPECPRNQEEEIAASALTTASAPTRSSIRSHQGRSMEIASAPTRSSITASMSQAGQDHWCEEILGCEERLGSYEPTPIARCEERLGSYEPTPIALPPCVGAAFCAGSTAPEAHSASFHTAAFTATDAAASQRKRPMMANDGGCMRQRVGDGEDGGCMRQRVGDGESVSRAQAIHLPASDGATTRAMHQGASISLFVKDLTGKTITVQVHEKHTVMTADELR